MISIDKQDIAFNDITFSEVGFGRVENTGFSDYELEISRVDFCEILRAAYDSCISELKRDDAITGVFDAPYPGALDYPSLEDFVDAHMGHFVDFFNTYLKFDFFRSLLQEEDASCAFILASLDGIRTNDGKFVVFGRARKLSAK